MGTLNKVILMENLTHDPQMRYTPNGTTVLLKMRWFATNKGYKDTSYDMDEATVSLTDPVTVDIDFFGNDAKSGFRNSPESKGSPILIDKALEG